jgi:hypothetical protein
VNAPREWSSAKSLRLEYVANAVPDGPSPRSGEPELSESCIVRDLQPFASDLPGLPVLVPRG